MATAPVQQMDIAELPEGLAATIERELGEGRAVKLVRDGKLIGEVRSANSLQTSQEPVERPRMEMPDFAARLKEMWGDRIFPNSTVSIREDRDGDHSGGLPNPPFRIKGYRADGSPIPDFAADLKEIFGDKVFPAGTTDEWIQEERRKL